MLTHHEIVDRIVKQIVLVITEMCKESKLCQNSCKRSSFSFTYLFEFTYFCIVDIWALKREFCRRK